MQSDNEIPEEEVPSLREIRHKPNKRIMPLKKAMMLKKIELQKVAITKLEGIIKEVRAENEALQGIIKMSELNDFRNIIEDQIEEIKKLKKIIKWEE